MNPVVLDARATRTWAEAATYRDATEAALASAVAGTPGVVALLADATQVVFAGAGSSYHLAQTAAFAARAVAGLPAVGAPVSELLLRPEAVLRPGPAARQPILVISRSGSTTEAVAVGRRFGAAGHPVVAVTCRGDSPLARLGSVALVSPAGDEREIVMTRSFTSMLAMLLRVVAAAAPDGRLARDLDRLPACWGDTDAAVERAWDLASSARWTRAVMLGGGAAEGIALEARLKVTETGRLAADAYAPFEFRHGPISVCEPSVLVVGLLLDEAAAEEDAVLADARALGASTWRLGPDPGGRRASHDGGETVSPIGTAGDGGPALHPIARLPLAMPPLQALALGLAVARSQDPDAPRHLTQVVELGRLA